MKLLMPLSGRITSKFGDRIHPVTRKKTFHNGIDIAGPIGEPIYSPDVGIVTDVYTTEKGGLTLITQHGGVESRMCHLDKVHVKKGDQLARGQRIADCGNTGVGTGPHLHWGLKIKGNYVNPEDYI